MDLGYLVKECSSLTEVTRNQPDQQSTYVQIGAELMQRVSSLLNVLSL